MKKLILILLLFATPCYAGINLIDQIVPKNDGFQGLVDDDQIIDTANTADNILISDGTYFSSQANPSGAEVNNLETVCTNIADDEIPVGTAANTAIYKAIPDCDDGNGHLNYDITTNAFSCGTTDNIDDDVSNCSDVNTCETDPNVDTHVEIIAIIDNTATDFGTGVLTAAGFIGPLTGAVTGNSSTASALAANPSAATAGSCITDINASGDIEGEVDVWTEAENTNAAYAPLDSPTFTTAFTATGLIGDEDLQSEDFGEFTCAGEDACTLDDSVTVTGWVMGTSTATTPSADDNDTSLATTAYVQGELNARRITSCRTLETPTDDNDNIPVWAFPQAFTITDVHCYTEGGTSIAVTISDGTNALEAVTCDADGADDDGSITNGTFTANENIEWDFAAPTGDVDWVKVCISGTIATD